MLDVKRFIFPHDYRYEMHDIHALPGVTTEDVLSVFRYVGQITDRIGMCL